MSGGLGVWMSGLYCLGVWMRYVLVYRGRCVGECVGGTVGVCLGMSDFNAGVCVGVLCVSGCALCQCVCVGVGVWLGGSCVCQCWCVWVFSCVGAVCVRVCLVSVVVCVWEGGDQVRHL